MASRLTLSDKYVLFLSDKLAKETGRNPLWYRRRIMESVDYFNETGRSREGYEDLTRALVAP